MISRSYKKKNKNTPQGHGPLHSTLSHVQHTRCEAYFAERSWEGMDKRSKDRLRIHYGVITRKMRIGDCERNCERGTSKLQVAECCMKAIYSGALLDFGVRVNLTTHQHNSH